MFQIRLVPGTGSPVSVVQGNKAVYFKTNKEQNNALCGENV
jgi:hypothetical protein